MDTMMLRGTLPLGGTSVKFQNVVSSAPESLERTTEVAQTAEIDSDDLMCDLLSWRESAENLEEADEIISLITACYKEGATELSLLRFRSITKLPPLPPNLTKLIVSGWSSLKKLSGDLLPPGLSSLEVSLCPALEELSGPFPPLIKLDATGGYALKKVEDLPSSLEELILTECKLTSLSGVPLQLVKLNVSWNRELKALPTLPLTLTSLNIAGCGAMVKVPTLPARLKEFYVTHCGKLIELPEDLSQLQETSLNLLGCFSLQKLPIRLSPKCTSLNITRCFGLKGLSDTLSPTIEVIGCPKHLEDSLKSLRAKVATQKESEIPIQTSGFLDS